MIISFSVYEKIIPSIIEKNSAQKYQVYVNVLFE